MKDNEGVLKIKRMVYDTCINYDDEINSCIRCNNAVYRFIYSNGLEVGNKLYYKKGFKEEIYLLEFLDYIPSSDELECYLLNCDSNYKVTRLRDGKIIRNKNLTKKLI